MDELEARQAHADGEAVKDILHSEAFEKTLMKLEDQLKDLMADTTRDQVELRDHAHTAIHVARKFRQLMIRIAEDGDLAAADLGLEPSRNFFKWR